MSIKYTNQELLDLIAEDTALIAQLEANPVTPEFYSNNFPKGDYARYVTKIKDAYWRRRNWRTMQEEL